MGYEGCFIGLRKYFNFTSNCHKFFIKRIEINIIIEALDIRFQEIEFILGMFCQEIAYLFNILIWDFMINRLWKCILKVFIERPQNHSVSHGRHGKHSWKFILPLQYQLFQIGRELIGSLYTSFGDNL